MTQQKLQRVMKIATATRFLAVFLENPLVRRVSDLVQVLALLDRFGISSRNTEDTMSASHEWNEYHLTPAGWVAGNSQMDSGPLPPRPIPPNRLLTRRYTDRMSSPFSKIDKYWNQVWTSEMKAEIGEALSKFGPHPSELLNDYQHLG